jgi:hypothetical protein
MALHGTAKHSKAQQSTAKHSKAQQSTAKHSKAQQSTDQHSITHTNLYLGQTSLAMIGWYFLPNPFLLCRTFEKTKIVFKVIQKK